MTNHKLPGTIQVDVDDLWVYYESIGLRAPANCPSPACEQGVPRLLDLFDRFGIRATFFVCGRDAWPQRATLAEVARRGHEIANHSTWHRTGFASLSSEEKRADILTTHHLLTDAVGIEPRGFKSPGFSFAADQLDVLAGLGYRYDSSLLPTPYAPLMRAAQRVLSGGTVDPTHYGKVRYGAAPLRPYRPDRAAPHRRVDDDHARNITPRGRSGEVGTRPAATVTVDDVPQQHACVIMAPVTTMPLTRLPMHSTFVFTAGQPLFDAGLALSTACNVPMNYLLHAGDAIDAVTDPALASYRFLNQPWDEKRALLEHMLAALSATYKLMPTLEYVDILSGR